MPPSFFFATVYDLYSIYISRTFFCVMLNNLSSANDPDKNSAVIHHWNKILYDG